MPKFAEHIEVTDGSLKINGEEFPFYLAEGGIEVGGAAETLTLTLLTGRAPKTSGDSGCRNPDCGLCRLEGITNSQPPQDSMLDAAKLSLKEAERLEAKADEQAHSPMVGSAGRAKATRKQARDELLLANAQASIAVAEALGKQGDTSPDDLFRRAGLDVEKLRELTDMPMSPSVTPGGRRR